MSVLVYLNIETLYVCIVRIVFYRLLETSNSSTHQPSPSALVAHWACGQLTINANYQNE